MLAWPLGLRAYNRYELGSQWTMVPRALGISRFHVRVCFCRAGVLEPGPFPLGSRVHSACDPGPRRIGSGALGSGLWALNPRASGWPSWFVKLVCSRISLGLSWAGLGWLGWPGLGWLGWLGWLA